MSRKIEAKIEIRDMKILKDTLNKMGFSTKDNGKTIRASKNYTTFNFSEGSVLMDDMHRHELEPVLSQYAKNFEVAQLEMKGRLYNINETENEIIIGVKAS